MRFRSSRRPEATLTGRQALILGVLHGPTELLPISSSAHVIAVPWLLGWDYSSLEAEDRKSFEVALHAGTLAALWAGGDLDFPRLALAPASVPPGVAGLALERMIERRAGAPALTATGLSVGALAMLLADRRREVRVAEEANARDALWLGLAQACALLPGVSRSGATFAAARFLGFGRVDARLLSAQVAAPVIAGAVLLKSVRLLRRRPPREVALGLATGAGASFASTFVTARLARAAGGATAAPYATYRLGLAFLMLVRAEQRRRARRHRAAGPRA